MTIVLSAGSFLGNRELINKAQYMPFVLLEALKFLYTFADFIYPISRLISLKNMKWALEFILDLHTLSRLIDPYPIIGTMSSGLKND